jgi:hypothetical protein
MEEFKIGFQQHSLEKCAPVIPILHKREQLRRDVDHRLGCSGTENWPELREARMQRKQTKIQAERLLADYGPAAYEKALEAERTARRKQDKRLAKFLGKVARVVASSMRNKKLLQLEGEPGTPGQRESGLRS